MGHKVKNGGILAFRVRERLVFTGFAGLGLTGEHRTGTVAVDLDGLRRVQACQPSAGVGGHLHLHEEQRAVLDALAARYGWDERPYPTGWYTEMVPGEQLGIGIEVDADGELVCLPVLGGPGRHECPDATLALDGILQPAPYSTTWPSWFGRRTAMEREELCAVVEGLRRLL